MSCRSPIKCTLNIAGADKAGLQIAIHAIGDRAINTILNFYERAEKENGPRDRRFRIEHAQHLLKSDIPRFAALHVIASMQPYHAIDDGRWAAKRIDPERIQTTYAFRSLLDSGATLAFGSDWPVAPMVPLMGIYAAVTRRTLDGKNPGGWVPEQKITVAEPSTPTRSVLRLPNTRSPSKARSRPASWLTWWFSPKTYSTLIQQRSRKHGWR